MEIEIDQHVDDPLIQLTDSNFTLVEELEVESRHHETTSFLVFLLPVIIICGCVVNILASLVTIRGRLWLKSEGYIYLLAVFVLNFLKLTILFGQSWLYEIIGYHLFASSNHGCRAFYFVSYCLAPATAWLVAAFAFDVYVQRSLGIDLGQCSSRFARGFCRNGVAAAVICAVFILTGSVALFYVGNLNSVETRGHHYCVFTDWFIQRGLRLSVEWFLSAVPMQFLIPLMFVLVATHGGKKPDDTTQPCDAYDSFVHFPRAAVLCLVAVVLVCLIPIQAVQFLFVTDALRVWHGIFSPLGFDIIGVIASLSYVFVPVVCLAMMPEFKAGIKQVFSCGGNAQQVSTSEGHEDVPLAPVQSSASVTKC